MTVGLCAGRVLAAVPDGYYGMNVQGVFSGAPGTWAPQLAAMASSGAQLGRIDARWSDIEPTPPSGGVHSYRWAKYDAIVQAMAQQGVRWAPIVAYSTSWSGVIPGDSNSAVASSHLGDFAVYAAALARRYGRNGSFWSAHSSLPRLPVFDYEVWNEENSTTFLRPQDSAPERFADLYVAARSAIKGVDPQARVTVGGLALSDPPAVTDEIQFVQRMYAHRPNLHVDGVGLHPYQRTLADTYMRLAKFRSALDRIAGVSVPIEITEVGWSTTSVPESERTSDLGRLVEELPRSDCNVDRLMPYAWVTQETDPSNPEDWFGIWNHDATPKPSGLAYTNAVKLMRGMTPARPPSAAVGICRGGGAAARARAAGPPLSLKVVRIRPRRFVTVRVRCRTGCTLRLDLLGRANEGGARLIPLSTRKAVLHGWRRLIRVPIRHARAMRRHGTLRAIAVGRSGGVTKRYRKLRIR